MSKNKINQRSDRDLETHLSTQKLVTKQLDINNAYAKVASPPTNRDSIGPHNSRKPIKHRSVLNGSIANGSALQHQMSNQRLDQILTFPHPADPEANLGTGTTRSSSINLI